MATLARAIEIASAAHAAQTDKAGEPYFGHLQRVMDRVDSEEEKIVAALHDVVEDCQEWSLDMLRAEGFSAEVLAAVEALTKRTGETRLEAAARAANHPVALVVKLADNADNSDLSRLRTVSDADRARMNEYAAVRALLLAKLAV